MPTLSLATDKVVMTATASPNGEWTARWSQPGGRLECLAASADRQFVGSDGGILYRQPVNEETWEPVLERGDRATAVTVGPSYPDDVFVSAASGARTTHDPDGKSYVYRRAGEDWRRAMDGLPTRLEWGGRYSRGGPRGCTTGRITGSSSCPKPLGSVSR